MRVTCEITRRVNHNNREHHARQQLRLSQAAQSPSQRRKARNGPRPAKRAAAEATLRALDFSHSTTPAVKASARSVASPPTRRMLVAARSSLATHPGAFGPSSCLSRRPQFAQRCVTPIARRAARQPTAWPSARPTGAVAASRPSREQTLRDAELRAYRWFMSTLAVVMRFYFSSVISPVVLPIRQIGLSSTLRAAEYQMLILSAESIAKAAR